MYVSHGTRCNAVDGVQIALGALLVKGEERGRFEGKHGKGRHEGIGEGNIHIVQGDNLGCGKAAVHQAKERIGGEMLAYFAEQRWPWEYPVMRTSNRSSQGVFSHRGLRKASAADPVITGLGGSAGIAVGRLLYLITEVLLTPPWSTCYILACLLRLPLGFDPLQNCSASMALYQSLAPVRSRLVPVTCPSFHVLLVSLPVVRVAVFQPTLILYNV